MARLNVNPTRMVLSKLKGQLKVAIKGHKLMKDKRDELMRIFLEEAKEIKAFREEIDPQLEEVYQSLVRTFIQTSMFILTVKIKSLRKQPTLQLIAVQTLMSLQMCTITS